MQRSKSLLGTAVPRVTSVIALHGKYKSAKEAVKFPGDAAKTYTYGQFVTEMDAVASRIKYLGLEQQRVATLLANDSPRTLTTMLGCVRGGACLVPLNATLQPNQVERMLNDCKARLVIASETYTKLVPDSAQGFNRVGLDFAKDAWTSSEPFFQAMGAPITESTDGEDEFNIIFSSGTTSSPKGILLTHANRLHWAWSNAIAMRFQHDSKALTTTALYSNGTFLITLPTLFVGATLHVMKQFDPKQTLEIIQRERITHVFMVPTQLKMCIDAGAASYDLSSLRMVLSAGSTLASELKKRVLKEISPNLFELYGNSEGFASMLFPEEQQTKFTTVGRPLFGNEVRIVEPEGSLELRGHDQCGEICVRGPGMMSGYNNRYDETIKDTWVDATGAKFFRTGDMGKIDSDGYITLMERKKDMIISGGFNVFPKDIEEVMLGHDAIQDVAVVAGPHDKWGETPVAIVIPKQGSNVTAQELKEWTNQRVSKVQRVFFVKILISDDVFPRNVLGKVVKKDLRSRLSQWGVPTA